MYSAGGIDLPDLELLGHSGGILIIVRVAVRDDDGIAVGAVNRAGGEPWLVAAGDGGTPAVGIERFRFLDRPCRPDWEIGEGDGLAGVQGQDGFAVVKPNALQLCAESLQATASLMGFPSCESVTVTL